MPDALPAAHSPIDGWTVEYVPSATPHTPLTGVVQRLALQCAVVPPFVPAQLHVHGPEPATAEAVPVLHRLLAIWGAVL